jgi:hypothetical protein
MALASSALTGGDVRRAIDVLAELDDAAPSVAQFEAAKLVAVGTGHGADRYVSGRDFAGLLIWFDSVRRTLDSRPHLRRSAMMVAGEYAERVFDLPRMWIEETLDVDVPPLPAPVAPSARAGYAVVTIRNKTNQAMTVYLRGDRDYRTRRPILPGDAERLVVRAGRYAEAVHGGTSDPVPYLGVLSLEPVEYVQEFTVRDLSLQRMFRPAAASRPVVPNEE